MVETDDDDAKDQAPEGNLCANILYAKGKILERSRNDLVTNYVTKRSPNKVTI